MVASHPSWRAVPTDAQAPESIAQGCEPLSLIALHDLNRQGEVDEPRLQERQRQHVFRVDIVRAVTGVGSDIEL